MKYQTTSEVLCYDPKEYPPPLNTKIYCVSKYGVGRLGYWVEDFDIAWYPLPKLPQSVKDLINERLLKA